MEYSSADIKVLPSSLAIRSRPELYVGDASRPYRANELLREALCCARDEALQGRRQTIDAELHAGATARIRDYGPGLPLTIEYDGRRTAETWFTDLFACANAKSSPEVAESTCLNGLAALAALSSTLSVRIYAEGQTWAQEYVCGVPQQPLAPVGPASDTGTEMRFTLDADVLGPVEFDAEEFVAWVQREVRNVTVRVHDLRTGAQVGVET